MLAKAVGFLMLPFYAHYLHGEGYGIIGMIDVVLSVLTLLVGYGVQQSMTRFYYEREGESARGKLIVTAILLMFFLVVVSSLPVLLFARQIAWLAFGMPELEGYIRLAVVTFMLSMTSRNAENYVLIQQKSIFYSAIALVKLILGLSLNIYFIVILELGVLGYLYSALTVALFSSIFMHWYAFSRLGLHFVRKDAKEILKYTLPLIPGYVAMFFRINTDRMLLRVFVGLAQVGVFEMLFKFATLIGFFVVDPFLKIWNVKRFEIADQLDGSNIIARMFTYKIIILMFAGLVLALEIPILLKILTPEEFWLSETVIGLAVLSRIILACYYHVNFGLLYAKKTHLISYVQVASAAINLISCLALIPLFGIMGAVIASCVANFFQCAMAWRKASLFYTIPFEWWKIIKTGLLGLVCFAVLTGLSVERINIVNQWLLGNFSAHLKEWMQMLGVGLIKDGKLLNYLVANISLVFDGIAKLLLAFIFFPGLFFLRVLQIWQIQNVLKWRSQLATSGTTGERNV